MNIRDLEYIVNVAGEGSFIRAAEKCFVSQPAMSIQIQKLEDELGVKIFERQNRSFIITKAGEEIIKEAKIILSTAQHIKNLAKTYQNPMAGELRIGAFPTLASYFFPEFVKKISKKFPELKLLLIEEKTNVLIEQLKSGKIDCALLASPIIDNEFKEDKIFEEQFYLAVPKNHELAKRKLIKVEELKNAELLLLEDGHCLRNQALEVCSMIGAYEKSDFRATSLETLRQMIIAGNGVTLIPEIAIDKNSKISYIKIQNAPKRTIKLYWRKYFSHDKLIRNIAREISID